MGSVAIVNSNLKRCIRRRDVTGVPGGVIGGKYIKGISVRELENIRVCGCSECAPQAIKKRQTSQAESSGQPGDFG